MALTWDATLETGVPELDRPHQQLFDALDDLLHAIRRGSSRDEVGRTLDFLCGYVRTHFREEEELMERSGYPARAEHASEHAAFARDLAALEDEHRRDGPSPGLILRVTSRVSTWLREHIGRVDRALGDHLRAA
jgi:hemerythrin-like metal-binding protein